MGKADKKQRHKAKRDAKRKELRRRNSVSPIKRLADAPGDIEYWMSDSFETNGQMQIFVYKRAAGLSGIACFLVDRGVVGLKDAWVKLGVDRAEFTNIIERSAGSGITMNRVKLEDVRRMIAGGIRWAHDNGMRLPKDWVRTASVIGGVGDWASADVSEFELEFAGHPEDLRRRLIGESFDSFVRRKDIDFIFNESAPYMDQSTGRYVGSGGDDFDDFGDDERAGMEADIPEEELAEIVGRLTLPAIELTKKTGLWLHTHGEIPSPELIGAWQAILLAATLSKGLSSKANPEEFAEHTEELLEQFVEAGEPSTRSERRNAFGQVDRHLIADRNLLARPIAASGMNERSGEEKG